MSWRHKGVGPESLDVSFSYQETVQGLLMGKEVMECVEFFS